MTFKERYVSGEIEFEVIDDYVEEWSNGDNPQTLSAFLGFTGEEEDLWIEDSEEALKELLDKQKKG